MCLSKVDLSNCNGVGLLLDNQLIDKNMFLHTKISYFAQNMQFWGSRICESPLALS